MKNLTTPLGTQPRASLATRCVCILKKHNLNTSLDNNVGIFGLLVPVVFGFNKIYYSTGKGDRLDKTNFIKLYSDADKHKLDILKENEGKSGIYL